MFISNKNKNIVLIGFMGTGKTVVGKFLSSSYDLDLIDTDELIEKKTGMSISDIFDKHGGAYFRDLENQVLVELKNVNNCVISTGGGIVLRPENRTLLSDMGTIFHLKASFEEILRRVEGTENRPLLDNIDKYECVSSLWKERKELYDIAHFEINTDLFDPQQISVLINMLFKHSLVYDVNWKKTTVICKSNIISKLELLLGYAQNGRGKRIIITDENIDTHYKRLFYDKADEVITLPAGERIKSMENVQKIYDIMLEKDFNRNDLVICIGGGTVLDMGGFVASTFKRGCRLCFIPTTLLSLVDASVGGKNGVNYKDVKNIIGNFYQPDVIVADTIFLKTLPQDEMLSGYGELIKYILLTRKKTRFVSGEDISDVISLSIEYKADIVEKDERDISGRRALLNLGHTFAHVIEALSKNSVSHGQAVADGLVWAYKFSRSLELIERQDVLDLYTVRESYGIKELFFDLKKYDIDDIIKLLKKDKKNIDDDISFILPVRKDDNIVFETKTVDIYNIKRLWSVL
ncbi:MAG: hypothetical protein C0601_07380 [Candidatus Muiribacterium halophilum]|uniref:Shikimate kinase n=1 Tax=Muiribacterium halophilum TaxID=2053465 RepID=A0A2N5ZG01_MUIH1|nr:MAG: hypothetical protein C0601_07380 [Candidatus Muirbacterium halophilum]